MKTWLAAAAAAALSIATPAAAEEEIETETMAKIEALLASMQCELHGEAERDGEGYELDDVFCTDGQYDIMLDANLAVVEKRKE